MSFVLCNLDDHVGSALRPLPALISGELHSRALNRLIQIAFFLLYIFMCNSSSYYFHGSCVKLGIITDYYD